MEAANEIREEVKNFNEKNPGYRINPVQLAQSVKAREKRVREAKDGVYLPKNHRATAEAGKFAEVD